MMTTHPLVQALVKSDYSVLTRPDGQSERVGLPAGVDVRAAVLQRATSIAADMGERIELVISGTLGDLRLIVTPSGEVSRAETPTSPASVVADDAFARASQMIRTGGAVGRASEHAPHRTSRRRVRRRRSRFSGTGERRS